MARKKLHWGGLKILEGPLLASHGYGRAKTQLIAQGHEFERTRREFGFEEGVFIDG
jgi:hypothetical protein